MKIVRIRKQGPVTLKSEIILAKMEENGSANRSQPRRHRTGDVVFGAMSFAVE